MDRKQRGPRHAVLQTRPRRASQRSTAARQPLIERCGTAPEGENLRTGEFQVSCHLRPCHISPARTWIRFAGEISFLFELSIKSHHIRANGWRPAPSVLHGVPAGERDETTLL